MFDLFDTINEYIKDILCQVISSNLSTMFSDINVKTDSIASEVAKTPQTFNESAFNMVRSLSNDVMVPIAGIFIAIILCYELISMLTEKNNMHDIDTWMLYKWVFKSAIAIWLLTHVYDIVMAVFDVGGYVVDKAAGIIDKDTFLETQGTLDYIEGVVASLEVGELIVLCVETFVVSLCMKVICVLISVVLFARMIEIYLYTSVAPLPFSTFANREWGQIGNNYLRGLLALGFQGFLIMIVVGIYAAIIKGIDATGDIHSTMFVILSYTVVLCFSLFKTGTLSKQIFNAH